MCSGGSQTTVQKSDPWAGIQPYLVGTQTRKLKPGVTATYGTRQVQDPANADSWIDEKYQTNPDSDYEMVGTPGIYDEARRLYQGQGWTPDMQAATDWQKTNLVNRVGQSKSAYGLGDSMLAGQYDPNIERVSPITGVSRVDKITGPQSIMAMLTNPVSARADQGGLDPSSALGKLLSGGVSNPYLDQQASAITGQLTRNMQENVMPGIRSGAMAAGQYGGSRQGIAEGLAASRLNQDLAPALSQLYGNAYENAQQRMYGTAQSLNEQAVSNAQQNANRDFSGQTANAGNQLQTQQFNANLGLQNNAQALDTQKFNANLGLQNNEQAMQSSQQKVGNRMQGLSALTAGNSLGDANYQQYMNLLNAPNDFNWQNLGRYASIIQPGSGIGGSSSSTQSNQQSPLQTIGQIGGTAANAYLAYLMLSDSRLKTDIKKIGVTDGGLNVYTFRYKSGGPVQMGVMAQEVEQVIPDAVHEVDGFKMVDYSKLR